MLQLIRRPQLLQRLGVTDSGLDRMIRAGFAPPPVKLSPDPTRRAVGWPAYEAEEIVAARIAGLGPVETRALVADLIERRTQTLAAATSSRQARAIGTTPRSRSNFPALSSAMGV